jgi:hypothetical protein
VTLEEHARAIETAIQAAAADGFYLDDGNSNPPTRLELNEVDRYGDPVTWNRLDLPSNPI